MKPNTTRALAYVRAHPHPTEDEFIAARRQFGPSALWVAARIVTQEQADEPLGTSRLEES